MYSMGGANTGAPFYYDYINANTAPIMPSTVHVRSSGLSRFFDRYLLQRAMSVFTWDIPETWDRDYFLYGLYMFGTLCILDTEEFGVIPQLCGFGGYNVFYRPSMALVGNPLIKGGSIQNLQIGQNCELVKLQPDYCGVMDAVSMYADMLALCMEAAAVNLVNSHLSYALIAGNKAGAESLKKMFDDIASGEPAVAIDRRLFAPDGSPMWQAFNNDIKQNYIVTDLLNDMRTLYNQFDTEIGIPNANINKRERLITDEVNANNAESVARAALWLQELKESFEKVNNMFGLSLAVDWRNPPEETVSEPQREVENEE